MKMIERDKMILRDKDICLIRNNTLEEVFKVIDEVRRHKIPFVDVVCKKLTLDKVEQKLRELK